MALLSFLSNSVSKRNILFSSLGVACFPVGLKVFIPYVYQSFHLSGDPREGMTLVGMH